MTPRDWEYIEARLLAPSEGASEAEVRLRRLGYSEQANRLNAARVALQEVTRDVRFTLLVERQAGKW